MLPVIPVIASGFIVSILTPIFTFLLRFMTRKTAVAVGYTIAFLAALNILVAFFMGLLSLISYVVPDFVGQAASLVVPSNAPICVSVVVSARIALYVYAVSMKKITDIWMGS